MYRVVDDDVQPAEGIDRMLDEVVAGPVLGQVAGKGDRVSADLLRNLRGQVGVEVVDEDAGPVLG